jgi:hypothetical protein
MLFKAASQNVKKRYFLDNEFGETLSEQIYDPNAPIVEKEYVYESTGAKYEGQWKGGFRHGQGTMMWHDGARYEGEWQLGRAWGQGTFTHSKGEIF